MKKVISILLAAVLLLGTLTCVPFSVSAESEGDFEYEVFDGEAVVTRYTGSGGKVAIPDTLGGYPVTAIGAYAFVYCDNLTSVTLGKGVTTIGDSAFEGCTGLTSIVIPDSVTEIGYGVFASCYALQSVAIPDSVTVIGAYAFYYCRALQSVVIPDSVTEIGEVAFAFCAALESVTLGKGVASIEEAAFIYCTGLKRITVDEGNACYASAGNCLIEKETGTLLAGCNTSVIPEGVKAIGDWAFEGCTGLTSVTVPDSVTAIGEGAFLGCSGLTRIEIPESVQTMGSLVFEDCNSLTDIYCLASKQPKGWDADWTLGYPAFIHWGEAKPGVTGDLTGDEKVNATDYLLLKRYVLGTFGLSGEQKAVADVDRDGNINSVDYMLLKRAVLGTYTIGYDAKLYVKYAASVVKDGMTEEEAYKAVHDFVCDYLDYDFSYRVRSLSEAFMKRVGVCEAYARMTKEICDAVGIECEYVIGYADNGIERAGHAWNRVKINGTWYWTDTCWDGSYDTTYYDYYLSETLWSNHEELTDDWFIIIFSCVGQGNML